MVSSWLLVLSSWLLVLSSWLLVLSSWLLVVSSWLLMVSSWLFLGIGLTFFPPAGRTTFRLPPSFTFSGGWGAAPDESSAVVDFEGLKASAGSSEELWEILGGTGEPLIVPLLPNGLKPNSSITDLASAGSGSGSAKLALHTGEDPPSVSGLGREPEPNGGGEFCILDPPQLKGLKLSSSWSGSNL
ncbi:hypothetical protein EYF80_060306 [Liparis tanakae]|uniref:Uncharacterized protein n=1 Tax=Liparis tanakae TaxID=230148 RepID=A0A4Z2ELA9_9TELE|nr:hypothetical protein EYF80_060306 [Liparis tanakae]